MLSNLSYKHLYFLYFKYKDTPYFNFTLYSIVLVVSVLLIIFVVIPQGKTWFSIQEEIKETNKRIETITENIRFVKSLDDSLLQRNLFIASTAFPPEKDVSVLLYVINASALKVGVKLDDFSFQVGDIKGKPKPVTSSSGEQSTKITFNVRGSPQQIDILLHELYAKIPILSVESMRARFLFTNSAEVTIVYYYRGFPLISQKPEEPLQGLSEKNTALLSQLSAWYIPPQTFNTVSSSPSAVLAPF
jgi:hypothetical protein